MEDVMGTDEAVARTPETALADALNAFEEKAALPVVVETNLSSHRPDCAHVGFVLAALQADGWTLTRTDPDGLRAALRRWAELEASRRVTGYDDERYDDLERLAGDAATLLIAAARLAGIAEGLVGPELRAALAEPARLETEL